MITTVTMNTSIDKLYQMDHVALNQVMRVKEVSNTAGGKGLNVARVAALAGEKVVAAGIVGGFNGQYLQSLLMGSGVEARFTSAGAETRSCINIHDLSTGRHTEFLEPGAPVEAEALERFLIDFDTAIAESEVVTISGSAPKGTPVDFYGRLISRAKAAGKKVLLDTSGEMLIESCKAKPTLIKPNTDEIKQLLGREITSREELIEACLKIQSDGIDVVVVSLGKEGSLICSAEGVFQGTTPDIQVVNTVGCGDSMLAGFAVGFSRGYSIEETIQFATAISTANAMTAATGSFQKADFDEVFPKCGVVKI